MQTALGVAIALLKQACAITGRVPSSLDEFLIKGIKPTSSQISREGDILGSRTSYRSRNTWFWKSGMIDSGRKDPLTSISPVAIDVSSTPSNAPKKPGDGTNRQPNSSIWTTRLFHPSTPSSSRAPEGFVLSQQHSTDTAEPTRVITSRLSPLPTDSSITRTRGHR